MIQSLLNKDISEASEALYLGTGSNQCDERWIVDVWEIGFDIRHMALDRIHVEIMIRNRLSSHCISNVLNRIVRSVKLLRSRLVDSDESYAISIISASV